jgi:aspartyl-tRNA(Asn)/glutamyl-tRNA(Gln) amidotransferase subunit C
MKIDKPTVEKIAHLARLELTASQTEDMQVTMQQILTWMEKLNELDTTGVEPLIHLSSELNSWREDQEKGQLSREEALKNAPVSDGRFFIVPKVIE